jgi:lipoyl(octanoyl) transferase
MSISNQLIIKKFDIVDYNQSWTAMKNFNLKRDEKTIDEIWLMQHLPVYTMGLAGKEHHLLEKTSIPLIRTDRGGQITYHGPGQLIIYFLIDLRRKKLTITNLIAVLEEIVINYLKSFNCQAYSNSEARGVYINNKKIASIGLRVSRGCSYHGLSLNVNIDLNPFKKINPCGIENLEMVNIDDINKNINMTNIINEITPYLTKHLRYDIVENLKVDNI